MLQTKSNITRRARRKPSKTVNVHPQINSIEAILLSKGFKSVVPTDEVLQTLGISMIRFNKILDNRTELTLTEATAFADWLNVTLEELTPGKADVHYS